MLLLLLLTMPAVVQAQFNYTDNGDGTATITGYIGSGGDVTIPDEINGLPVTGIGDYALGGGGSLTSVTIGTNVTSIGGFAFGGCSGLTAITVDALNLVYSSVEGVLFNQSTNTLIQCPDAKAGSYTLPGTVTNIGDYAFSDCTSLISVTIPNGVTSIGTNAFFDCALLTSLTIPNGVTRIGEWAFAYSGLTNVTIPNGVTTIASATFNQCVSLICVTIGSGVTSIAEGAFQGCMSLSTITVDALNATYSSMEGVLFNKGQTTLIQCPGGKGGAYTVPNTVTNIGDYAFANCANLTSILIGDSVTRIGLGAFLGCGMTSVTIPNGISRIEASLFAWSGLRSVTIPSSVTTIGNYAFNMCTVLGTVYFCGNSPSLGWDAFGGDENATAYYLPGTTGWGSRYGYIPTALWRLPYPLILSSPRFGIRTNRFGFIISWATNLSVTVEARTNLAISTWAPVSTNALTNGWLYFSDPQWTNYPARFYRLRAP